MFVLANDDCTIWTDRNPRLFFPGATCRVFWANCESTSEGWIGVVTVQAQSSRESQLNSENAILNTARTKPSGWADWQLPLSGMSQQA